MSTNSTVDTRRQDRRSRAIPSVFVQEDGWSINPDLSQADRQQGLIPLVRAEVEELRRRGARGQEDDASDAVRRV